MHVKSRIFAKGRVWTFNITWFYIFANGDSFATCSFDLLVTNSCLFMIAIADMFPGVFLLLWFLITRGLLLHFVELNWQMGAY